MDIETAILFIKEEPQLFSDFWAALIHADSDKYLCNEYLSILANKSDITNLPYEDIGQFFLTYLHDEKLFLLYMQEYINRVTKEEGMQSPSLVNAFNLLGSFYFGKADYIGAMHYYKKSLGILYENGEKYAPITIGVEYWVSASQMFANFTKAGQRFFSISTFLKFAVYILFHLHTGKPTQYDAQLMERNAQSLASIGIYKPALHLLNKALSIMVAIRGESHQDVANILNSFGNVYSSKGDEDMAICYYNKALSIYEQSNYRDKITIARTQNNLASAYQRKGELNTAKDIYTKVLDEIKNEPTSQSLTAIVLNNLGNILISMGEYSRALGILLNSLRIKETFYGKACYESSVTRFLL